MSIVTCELMAGNAGFSEDGNYRRTYTHQYLIKTNSDTDLAPNIRAGWSAGGLTNPIPAMWSSYNVNSQTDSGSLVQARSLKRSTNDEGNRRSWIATVQWQPPQPGTSSASPKVENPLLRPVLYSMEWASHSRFLEYDLTGRPIANTAGDLFDPVEIDDARPVLVAVKNEWPLADIITKARFFKNAINDDVFYGAAAHFAKVESITSGTLLSDNNVDYYGVTYRIQFTEEDGHLDLGWDLRYVNRGPNYLDDDGHLVPCRVQSGKNKGQFIKDALLGTDGNMLGTGEEGIYVPLIPSEAPWFIFMERDFGLLGI